METKIDTHIQIRSSFSGGKSVSARRNAYKNFAETQSTKADTFTMSSSSGRKVTSNDSGMSDEMRAQLKSFSENIKNLERLEPLNHNLAKNGYDYAGTTKFNFDLISMCENGLNKNIPKKLEDAGVPKDVTFEFDFDFDSKDIEITEISDEKYRESVENVLAGSNGPFTFISCASRVMNGNISSLYYPWVSNALDRCFEQDINDLYIDEKGNLGGVNKNLQAAFDAEKKAKKDGEYFSAIQEFDFPVNNIKDIVTRLVSDENITPNISHMGYDGERIYTNDGEFKFGKDFDPNLFGEEKYVMRGTSALYMTFYGHTDLWLKNYEKFY